MKQPENHSDTTQPLIAHVALTGNPNCVKTALYTAHPGLRARVSKCASLTVECKGSNPTGIQVARAV